MKQPIPFGKYYLLERINVGGMAEVFKAKATGVEGFERMVAVKRILPSIAEDEEFITMFIDEAKISVQLTHANIAQIFDLGKVSDSFFIALEFVHGKDLRAIFNRTRQRGEPLPIPMACYVIMKLCEGLDYAHNKREATGLPLALVHRDVSPQNILVSYEGEVKIIDFGIAKAAGKAGKTQAGILKGKFGYMSPEQVQGMEIDRRSDIFGVGICLYELLTGERLFVGESDFATLEKVRNVEIMPPSTYNRRIPPELEQIVLGALAKDLGERHQTAMQLHDDLQAFMYTSGNFFGRRDLSMYMQRVFAEELEKEKVRDAEYAAMDLAVEEEELSGLEAFEELDPVSAVSELSPSPYQQQQPMQSHHQPVHSHEPAYAPASNRKPTLLGMPAVASAAPLPQVPRPLPGAHSIPPSRQPAPVAGPGLDMDWDDEELSTQIYDKPEDLMQVMAGGALPPHQQMPGSLPPGSLPPALGGPVARQPHPTPAPHQQPGVPSPFAGGAAPVQRRNDPTDVLGADNPYAASRPRQNRSALVAAASVVVILLAVVGGLLFFKAPSPGTIHLTTIPKDAAVSLNDQRVPGQSSPFVVPDVIPGQTHQIMVSKDGFKSWTSKVELSADQVMELPTVSLEKIESGFALDSVPSGATVFVDDQKLAQATPVRVTNLAPGPHQIKLQKEGHAPWQSSLQVSEGHVLSLPAANLMATKAEGVAASPVAKADDRDRERTRERSRDRDRSTRPRPRPRPRPTPSLPSPDEPVVRVTPKPAPAAAAGGTGTLRVQTRPWSQVFVDGRLIGTTPQMGIKLSSGRHTVTFVNDDFGIRKTIKVNLKSGETVTKVLTLSPGM